MCMEDVRIARDTATTSKVVVSVSDVWVLALPANPDRYSISFQTALGNDTSIVCSPFGVPTVGQTVGPPSGTFLLFDLQHHGDMVCQPWYYRCDVSNFPVYIVETVLRKQ